MFNTLKLSKSHVERGLAANPQFRKYEDKLRQMDKNQDGEIDVAELCQVLDEMSTIEKHRKLLKGACYVLAVFSLLTIAAIVGLTYAVVDLTKDSQVSSSGILVTKDSAANPIATGQTISLDDAGQLFTKNLNDLSDLEFLIIPSEIGGTVVYVAEVELVANTSAKVTTTAGTVYEIDASGIHRAIAGGRRKLLQVAPAGATSGFTTSSAPVSTTTTPVSPTPVSPTPVSPTPVSPTPVSPTPVSPTPVSPTPVSPTPVSPTPVSPTTTPVSPTPVSPTPVSTTPVSPTTTPVSPTPVSPTPVSPTPVSPTPVSPTTTPVSPTPVSPTPVSTTPTSPTPTPVSPTPTLTVATKSKDPCDSNYPGYGGCCPTCSKNCTDHNKCGTCNQSYPDAGKCWAVDPRRGKCTQVCPASFKYCEGKDGYMLNYNCTKCTCDSCYAKDPSNGDCPAYRGK